MHISKSYPFYASHLLPLVKDGHPCKQLHGHGYICQVVLVGDHMDNDGMVMDFFDLDRLILSERVLGALDHHHLNDVTGLANPTAENIAVWVLRNLKDVFRDEKVTGCRVCHVRVYETPDSYAEVKLS